MKKLILCLISMVFLNSGYGFAQDNKGPLETLRAPVDSAIEILKDPQYQPENKKDEQLVLLKKIIKDIFDFKRISRLALGQFKHRFSQDELEKFSELFTDISSEHYLTKIQGHFSDEKVKFLNEKITDRGQYKIAEVDTQILRNNVAVPVQYKMWLNNGKWRIYDVRVEGVSLVVYYRDQYQKILVNKSPAEFITELEKTRKKG